MKEKLNLVRQILNKYNQQHLLNFYEELSENNKLKLINQIYSIDFEEMKNLYENSKRREKLKNRFSPISYIIKKDIDQEKLNMYFEIGKKIIKKNEIAVLTMAGGQGSRLKINGPKGIYEVEINGKKKSLFEIIFDNIKKVNDRYKIELLWLIMTSDENDKQTKEFFKTKHYFNYNKNKIIFFKQGKKPILDLEGRLVLKKEFEIREVSNGNGDVFKALEENKVITILKGKGIKYISLGGIDNILAKPIDEIFLGLMIKENYSVATKSIFKQKPLSKTAVFCKIDGKPNILTYEHITKKLSNLKDNDGRYLYRDENILQHIMTLEAIEKVTKENLKYHRVCRKNSFLNTLLREKKYITEKSFKFEKFIFDAFSYFDDLLILRVEAENEFAPIKTMIGTRSPKEAVKKYEKYVNSLKGENK